MSYNSLFGLGTHAADVDLYAWYKGDFSGTTQTDSSGNGRDLTWNNAPSTGTNTPAWITNSTSNPSGYVAKSSSLFNDAISNVSFTGFVYDNNSTSGPGFIAAFGGSANGAGLGYRVTPDQWSIFTSQSSVHGEIVQTGTMAPTTLTHIAYTVDGDAAVFYQDGSASGSGTLTSSGFGTNTAGLGLFGYPGTAAPGDVTNSTTFTGEGSDLAVWTRTLAATEVAETEAGPEPLNLTAPVISQTATKISTTDGSWDSQANGTITYTYQWEVADDASGTNAENRGVLNAMYPKRGDNGKYVRVTIAASNDGGVDDAETQTTAWTLITADVPAEGKTAVVTGSLTATVSSTLDLTQSGFGTPNAAFLMWSSTTTAAEEESDPQFGYGVWTADAQYGVGIASVGAAGPERGFTDDIIYSPGLFRASAASTTDGIRLTVEGDNTSVTSFDITAILFDSNCFAEVGLSSPENLDFDPQVNALEFSGTGALFLANCDEFNVTGSSSAGSHCLLSCGAMDTYGRMAGWCGGQLTAGTNWAWMDSDFVAGQYTSGTSRTWYMSSEWSNAGYNLNMTVESGSASGDDIAWLALGNVGCSVGIENDPGANGESTFKSKGTTTPETTMFLSTIMQSTSTRATGAEAGCVGIGIDNQTTSKFYGFLFDEADDADNGCLYNADDSQVNWVSLGGGTHIKVKEASVSGFGSGAYTLDYTTGTGTARKFAAITFGSLAPADPSYNWMFGKGAWADSGGHPYLFDSYLMQEASGTTLVSDVNGHDGTWSADVTASSDTGPTNFLPNSVNAITSGLIGTVSDVAAMDLKNGRFTLLSWYWRNGSTQDCYGRYNTSGDNRSWAMSMAATGPRPRTSPDGGSTNAVLTTVNGPNDTSDTFQSWSHVGFSLLDDGKADVTVGGDHIRRQTSLPPAFNDPSADLKFFSIAQSAATGDDMKLAGMAFFTDAISVPEIDQHRLGPEPTSDGAPVLGGTFEPSNSVSVTDENFDLRSNGAGVYTYQWYRADDAAGTNAAIISGETASSYSIVAGDVGDFIGCFVTASNDGGNDPIEDTFSAFTEVTSGGPPPSTIVPIIVHHMKQMGTA